MHSRSAVSEEGREEGGPERVTDGGVLNAAGKDRERTDENCDRSGEKLKR